MPRKYDSIKAHLLRKGFSEKEAKTSAAKIYNAGRPLGAPPVTRDHEKTKSARRGGKR
jgi:hypothetical protein